MARPSRPAIPDALQREVLTPGVLCTYCTEVPADTIDHVVPVSRGGPTIRGNLVAACRRCNSRKNARPVEDFNPGRRLTPTEIDELGQAAEKVRTLDRETQRAHPRRVRRWRGYPGDREGHRSERRHCAHDAPWTEAMIGLDDATVHYIVNGRKR